MQAFSKSNVVAFPITHASRPAAKAETRATASIKIVNPPFAVARPEDSAAAERYYRLYWARLALLFQTGLQQHADEALDAYTAYVALTCARDAIGHMRDCERETLNAQVTS